MKSTSTRIPIDRPTIRRCVFMLWILVVLLAVGQVTAQEFNWLESWVFAGRPEADFRKRLQDQARVKIDQVDNICKLTASQKQKLLLATKGDVDRFFREIEAARKETSGLNAQDRNAVQQAWAKINPLATRLQSGLFNDDSLFSKVLPRTLDELQSSEYSRVMEEQTRRLHRALVLDTVASLEESLPLLSSQREKLVELILKQEIKPINGPMETYLGYAKLSKIPENELETFLDRKQVIVLKQLIGRYEMVLQNLQ
jgi:hypothetical protein